MYSDNNNSYSPCRDDDPWYPIIKIKLISGKGDKRVHRKNYNFDHSCNEYSKDDMPIGADSSKIDRCMVEKCIEI